MMSNMHVSAVMSVDDPDDKSTWTMFWVKIWKGPAVALQGQEAIDFIKGSTKGLYQPFQSAIDWTPDGSPCYVDEMKYWVPVAFDNHAGRVTLAGDAAHPMLICTLRRAVAKSGEGMT